MTSTSVQGTVTTGKGMTGHWIWCSELASPHDQFIYARRSFALASEVSRGVLHIAADSRYQLLVNGESVGRGPARFDRHVQEVDSWDITPHLRIGPNAIAVVIRHFAEGSLRYQKGPPGFLASLSCESEGGDVHQLGTDESWKVMEARAWTGDVTPGGYSQTSPEVYDAQRAPTGWTEPEFDDEEWEDACVLDLNRTPSRAQLGPRSIPHLETRTLAPQQIVQTGYAGGASPTYRVDLASLGEKPNGIGYLHTNLNVPKRVRAKVWIQSDCSVKMWVNGRPFVRINNENVQHAIHSTKDTFFESGWNSFLIKLVGPPHRCFFQMRFSSEDLDEWTLSASRDKRDLNWRIISPFPSDEPHDTETALDTVRPPENVIIMSRKHRGYDERMLRWLPFRPKVTRYDIDVAEVMAAEEPSPGRDAVDDAENLLESGEGPAIVRTPELSSSFVILDFGRQVAGHIRIGIRDARGGEIVDVAHAEVLEDRMGKPAAHGDRGDLNPLRGGVHAASRFTCASGNQVFETFERHSFRYLKLVFRDCPSPIKIDSVDCALTHYPVESRGRFSCSDERLTEIWNTGAYTVKLNMEDAYTNSPWHERAQWATDTRISALVNYYAFGDPLLMRRALRAFARSQDHAGLIHGVWPSDSRRGNSPDQALSWLLALREYHLHTGDHDLVRELFPKVLRLIRGLGSLIGREGLIDSVPQTTFIDCAELQSPSLVAGTNAYFIGALKSAIALAKSVGHDSAAEAWSKRVSTLTETFYRCHFDEERGLFGDHRPHVEVDEEEPEEPPEEGAEEESEQEPKEILPIYSEQTNVLAVLFDLVPAEKRLPLMEQIFGEEPPEDLIRSASPYASFLALWALERLGQHDEALEILKERWGQMLDFGATTWWEQWDPRGGHCHARSAGPTFLLSSFVLGVHPTGPGFSSCVISPRLGDLEWAEGRIPTPRGKLHVAWDRRIKKSQLQLEVQLPPKTRAKLVLPPLEGELVIDGMPMVPSGVVQLPDGRARQLILSTPEKHTFTIH